MSSDAKGCFSALVLFLAVATFGGCWRQRQDAREITALVTLINNVHTLLEKGKVRQAMELLEDRKREMDQQAARDAD